jgi:hypothetical protein
MTAEDAIPAKNRVSRLIVKILKKVHKTEVCKNLNKGYSMGKYGQAAVEAQKLLTNGIAGPRDAWEISTSQIFGKGTSSQIKGCPKHAFLGLCEEGLVRGVSPGAYASSKENKNKEYAIRAVNILKNNPQHEFKKKELWTKITKDEITHNQQMDVVLALWNARLLNSINFGLIVEVRDLVEHVFSLI